MIRLLTGLAVLGVSMVLVTSAGAADEQKDKKRDPAALFKKLDTNNDGKISKDEFLKIADKIKAKAGDDKAAKITQMLEKAFDKLDTNKDGYLSPDEFKAFKGFGKGKGEGFKKKKADNQ
jgi:Ca2+-binding EF-hand superfamily protein